MLSLFSCTCCLFGFCLWKKCLFPLPILTLFVFVIEFYKVLWILTFDLIRILFAKIFSHFVGCLHFVSCAVQKLLSFMVPFVDLAFVVCVIGITVKETAHFYSVRFKSLSHLELIFVNGVKDTSESIYAVSQHY